MRNTMQSFGSFGHRNSVERVIEISKSGEFDADLNLYNALNKLNVRKISKRS